MAAYKDKERGTWYVKFRYTDWSGVVRQKKKRGFQKKQDAITWEREFLNKESGSCDMLFSSFVEIYLEDCRKRLRPSTLDGKERALRNQISPVFGNTPMNQITPAMVRKWQVDLMSKDTRFKKPWSATGLRRIHAQLSSVFNFAVKYYGLRANPARVAGSIGRDRAEGMLFWTKAEFDSFIAAIDNPLDICAYNVLFYTGIRSGELRALCLSDFDLKKRILRITKNMVTVKKENIIGPPKTPKSKRDITLPQFLCDIVSGYASRLVDYDKDDLLFPISKPYLLRHLHYGADAAGLRRIRVHDLRHSHASYLINLGFPILVVSERLGHENIKTTLQMYGHLYPEVQGDVASKLDQEHSKKDDSGNAENGNENG